MPQESEMTSEAYQSGVSSKLALLRQVGESPTQATEEVDRASIGYEYLRRGSCSRANILSARVWNAIGCGRFEQPVEPLGQLQQCMKCQITIARLAGDYHAEIRMRRSPARCTRREWLGAELPQYECQRFLNQVPMPHSGGSHAATA